MYRLLAFIGLYTVAVQPYPQASSHGRGISSVERGASTGPMDRSKESAHSYKVNNLGIRFLEAPVLDEFTRRSVLDVTPSSKRKPTNHHDLQSLNLSIRNPAPMDASSSDSANQNPVSNAMETGDALAEWTVSSSSSVTVGNIIDEAVLFVFCVGPSGPYVIASKWMISANMVGLPPQLRALDQIQEQIRNAIVFVPLRQLTGVGPHDLQLIRNSLNPYLHAPDDFPVLGFWPFTQDVSHQLGFGGRYVVRKFVAQANQPDYSSTTIINAVEASWELPSRSM